MSRKGILFAGVLAVIVITAVAAFACTNLATLNLSSSVGQAGDNVTITGSSFRSATATAPAPPVVLSWNGASGPALATVTPDSAGNISATVTVPQAAPGYYVIVATQKDAKGNDQYGTPARAAFQILGATGSAAPQTTGAEGVAPLASEPISTGMIALTALLGVLGLGLFGAGMGAFVRQARRREVPAPVRK